MALKKIIDMEQDEISYENLKKRYEHYSRWYRVFIDVFVFIWFQTFLILFFFSPVFIVYFTFYTRLWFLILLYYCWIYYDRDTPQIGGRKVKLHKPIAGEWVRDYFPIAMIKTADLPTTKNYIFCTYPHAMLCFGGTTNFVHDPAIFEKLYPGLDMYTTTLTSNFFIPIFRDMLLSAGTISVSEKGIVNLLNKRPNSGVVCNIVIGGAAEALYSELDEYKIILKNRKGFVRVALKTGSSLVPVFCFGENEIYDQLRGERLRKFQEKLYRLTGYAPVFPVGRKFGRITSHVPRVTPVITVVGRPLDVPKIENPTKDQVDKYHSIFADELHDMFEKYKGRCDPLGNEARLTYV